MITCMQMEAVFTIFKEEGNFINLENVFNDIPVFESVQDIIYASD